MIKHYRFVVERQGGQITNAYAAPWEGSQDPGNDWVAYADHERYVDERVAAAVKDERERWTQALLRSIHSDDLPVLADMLRKRLEAMTSKPVNTAATCELCGEPMPPGEEMFKYHGYSGPCPPIVIDDVPAAVRKVQEDVDAT